MFLADLQRAVLLKLLELSRAAEAVPEPPTWKRSAWLAWNDWRANGLSYSPSGWFGAKTEALQTRYRRSIDSLERAGLVATSGPTGARLTRVGLTAEGRREAEAIAAAAAAN